MNTATLEKPKESKTTWTKQETARIESAKAEITRLREKLASTNELRREIEALASKWVSGEVSMTTAAMLLTFDSTARLELQMALRKPVKEAIRRVCDSMADLVKAARQAHVDTLKAKADSLEAAERAAQAEAGLTSASYQVSPAVTQLRKSHALAKGRIDEIIARGEVMAL